MELVIGVLIIGGIIGYVAWAASGPNEPGVIPQIKKNSQPSKDKEKALRNRLKDTSWGYAIAHIIPLVEIYYAWTRRTLTPLLRVTLGQFFLGFMIGSILSDKPATGVEAALTLAVFAATPFLAKSGIMSARDEARKLLGTQYSAGSDALNGDIFAESNPYLDSAQKQINMQVENLKSEFKAKKIPKQETSASIYKTDEMSNHINLQTLDELAKLKDMHERGLIDQEEYSQLKKRILGL